jgi:hypothetical protein
MDYPRVYGFTDCQLKHADVLWSLQSSEDVEYYLSGLTGADFTDAQVALMMIAAEVMDDVTEFDLDLTQVLEDLK